MNAISPKRDEDFAKWYQEVVKPLAQHGDVRGTQVIKPLGYGVWEILKAEMDHRIKSKDVDNFYAPVFVRLKALSEESSHIKGFATECAVVTHSRLVQKGDELVPDSPLTEPVVVRPTSEAIIGPIAKGWIDSYRDLPLKLNQWANVVRWEMRTRLFLRSSEFLWQEGHTFHQDEKSADDFAKEMWHCYAECIESVLAIPAILGEKSETERFAGAVRSYTVELLMQDGKALQGCTSHYLGQSFSNAYDISFTNQSGNIENAYGTSWGSTTRLIGALIMVHGDDDGLRLPPMVAPSQVVIIPINPKDDPKVDEYCQMVQAKIAKLRFKDSPVRVKLDSRDIKGSNKKWDWVKKGIPIRIELGPKDMEKNAICLSRRDQAVNQKEFLSLEELDKIPSYLEDLQNNLLEGATKFLEENTISVSDKEALFSHFSTGGMGFVKVPYLDDPQVEKELSNHQISVRCLIAGDGICVFSGKPTKTIAVIAKAY